MGFDDIEHLTLNWVGDISLGEMEFDHDEQLIPCVYESFCIEYELKFSTFLFEEQCDDSSLIP